MSTTAGASPTDMADDLPPGVAPSFGQVPSTPFEHTPEHLVLSSEAHSHLAGSPSLALLSGAFETDRLGRGNLTVSETDEAGQVHVHADLSLANGPRLHLDADVRESWLTRAAVADEEGPAGAVVVKELFRLAEIPRQSTVTISVDAAV
ncbi:MAG: hypothetical protein ABI577_08915 [bacterium]